MKKLSVLIDARHATSITLEDEFETALKEIARIQNRPINDIISEIDRKRHHSNLSSAVRIYILQFYQINSSKKIS